MKYFKRRIIFCCETKIQTERECQYGAPVVEGVEDGDDQEGDLRHQEEADHNHEHEGGVVRVAVLPALTDNLQHDMTSEHDMA